MRADLVVDEARAYGFVCLEELFHVSFVGCRDHDAGIACREGCSSGNGGVDHVENPADTAEAAGKVGHVFVQRDRFAPFECLVEAGLGRFAVPHLR